MSNFTESQKLIPGSGASASAEFGASVALSADANTALVGAPGNDGSIGAALVFIRGGKTWINQQTLLAPTSGADKEIGAALFGSSVALSSDGNTALVGAPLNNDSVGSALVFSRGGTTWINQQTLLAPTGGADKEIGAAAFGSSVALSSDGNTALVGAPRNNHGVGSALVFSRGGTTWINQQTLLAPTSGADKEIGAAAFGSSVALSSDGNTALIGAPANNHGVGSASVFIRKGTTWVNQHTLLAPTSGADKEIGAAAFGSSVALSSDGNTALVGAPGDNPGKAAFGTAVGAAWVFIRKGTTWGGGQRLAAPTSGAGKEIENTVWGDGQFGWRVALSADGTTALIAGPNDNGVVGAAWAFDFQPAFLARPAGWFEEQKLTPPATGPDKRNDPPKFGYGLSLSADGKTAMIGGPFDNRGPLGDGDAGAAWVFETPPPPPIK
jgi:hypothetical protein